MSAAAGSSVSSSSFFFFFFNDTATTEIYTLSLHDALPILMSKPSACRGEATNWIPKRPRSKTTVLRTFGIQFVASDRKSTRLNSSHLVISYAVFCLKKKNDKTPYVTRLDNTALDCAILAGN